MRPNTRGLGASMSSSVAADRSRTSIAIHGMSATAANTAHMPSENRQFDASATGTAMSGGVSVATAIVVEYTVVMSPMRSGKYLRTSGGSRMLPTPTAAKMSAVASSSADRVRREAAQHHRRHDDARSR